MRGKHERIDIMYLRRSSIVMCINEAGIHPFHENRGDPSLQVR